MAAETNVVDKSFSRDLSRERVKGVDRAVAGRSPRNQ